MKKLFILFCFAMTGLAAKAQNDHFIPKEKWNVKYYISDEFAKSKGLNLVETNSLLKAWNSTSDTGTFFRVVDIRYYLKDATEAKQYLEDNIKELSEDGDVIKEAVNIKASNVKAYTENDAMRKTNAAFGIETYMYFFLFTVDNYVAKVFVNTTKKIAPDEAAVFAREAASRLTAANKIVETKATSAKAAKAKTKPAAKVKAKIKS